MAFLDIIGKEKNIVKSFYLTGGTPLAVFYLQHRYSEDLDFFSEHEVDLLSIQSFLKKNKMVIGYDTFELQQSFNRNIFFINFPDENLKVEFTYFPFTRIEKGEKQYGVEIDSLKDIAVNKLFTIYQRTKARDYIDLYCIIKKNHYSIKDLISLAKVKFDWHVDPITLGAQFVKSRIATDLPLMIANVSPEEWQSFFIKEANKLKDDIFS